jgi:hypothetical protein
MSNGIIEKLEDVTPAVLRAMSGPMTPGSGR